MKVVLVFGGVRVHELGSHPPWKGLRVGGPLRGARLRVGVEQQQQLDYLLSNDLCSVGHTSMR